MSLDINYRDVLQILNMGGPHIGKLYLDNAFIDEDVIFKNVLYDVDKQNLYYIKCSNSKAKWLGDIYFTLNYINLETKSVFRFSKKFRMLHLGIKIDACNVQLFESFNTNGAQILFDTCKEAVQI